MEPVKLAEVMTRHIETATRNTPLVDVLESMRKQRLSCIPVIEDWLPVGVISERDVVEALADQAHGEPLPRIASELMTSPAITLHEEASVEAAIRLLDRRKIRRVIIVGGDGGMIGLITESNLVQAQALALERERDQLEEHVAMRTEQLRMLNERLEHMALVDPMLGVGNRRALDKELDRQQALAERFGRGFALIMFDIDEFKKLNDHYGHPEADAALGDLVGAAHSAIRGSDVLYRFGGEEFVVALPETEADDAVASAERIRGAVEALQIPHEPSRHGVVTVSLGIAVVAPNSGSADPAGVLRAADASLYEAKEGGRNRAGPVMRPEMAGDD